jgi:hypothetical protein
MYHMFATDGSKLSLRSPDVLLADKQESMVTSIVYETQMITVENCASTVINCPVDHTTVVTSVVPVSTTVCPLTVTSTYHTHLYRLVLYHATIGYVNILKANTVP